MHTSHKQHVQGFTLIETLVAMLILSFMLVAVTGLMSRIISANTTSQDRHVAAKLVSEGIELIKAKRNRNIADGVSPWTQNLLGVWEVDSTQKSALNVGSSFLIANPSSPRILCKKTAPASEAGKYAHNCATDSEPLPGNFTRIVEVVQISPYSIQVISTVTWDGGNEQVQVSTVLYQVS
jgi:prepilin-type N-terminal cleavage/methylation domain-containing protein